MRRPLIPILALVVLAACTESGLPVTSLEPPPTTSAPPGDADTPVTDPDDVVFLALADVERFWIERMPDTYGIEFAPLAGGVVPYGPRTPIPDCGVELSYEDVAGNALYCPPGDYIAWDRVNLIPELQADFGPLTTGMVMAHEYGHAIQARGSVEGPTVVLELQADCFAGAWVADVDDRIATFSTSDGALDQALAGLLELRDALGVDAADPNAHGSGFDRVSAFQDGFENGTTACADYEDDPPNVVALPFGSRDDFASGGNLPLGQLIDPLTADLESFANDVVTSNGGVWNPVDQIVRIDPDVDVITCGDEQFEGPILEFAAFYCVPSDEIYLDGDGLIPALADIGDFAFGGELARQYAFAIQSRLGMDVGGSAEGLHADCVSGVFAAAEFLRIIPDQALLLSPGDLDENVIAFLAFGVDDDVTAFDRTTAFRTGFDASLEQVDYLAGFDACDAFR